MWVLQKNFEHNICDDYKNIDDYNVIIVIITKK